MNGYLSSMSTTIIQSLTFIIFSVRENRNIKVFAAYGHAAGRPDTGHYIESHFL